jgi:predicted DNA-binding transcriptional regulator AlpA
MTSPEITGRDAGSLGPLGPNGSLVASPNQTMNYVGIGRAKFYELINTNELESYVEGSSRKVLWPSIHAYVKRRLAAEAARRGYAA